MSTPSAKRRRLEDAQSTLRKPFRSPFKTPNRKLELENPSADTTASSTAVPSPLVQSTLPDSSADQSFNVSSLRTLRNSRSSTTLSTPSKPRPFARRTPAPDDPLATAIRAEEDKQAALSKQIRILRTELDTLSQAFTVATSNQDSELEALTKKWRDTTRAAAEEVFATTRDRVDSYGGISAWKQNEQRQQDWRQGFYAQEDEPDLNETPDEDEDEDEKKELTPEEREAKLIAREQRAEARAEAKKERQWRKEQEAEEAALKPSRTDGGGDDDDDSFTMDMMLKTLNIDPETIGWDKEGQRWVD